VNYLFQRLQIGTMLGLSVAHSANDAQKSMGIITLGMFLAGMVPTTEVPIQVVALCAVAIALGAARGDWRLMRTLGRKIYTIRPINALASQASSAIVVLSSAILGAPVSTSQVISMALLGAGAAERANKVRWQVGFEMLITWLLTIPAAMLLAAVLVKIISLVHP
jgi:PiT family inorganic phosphate transporter